jgi:hypothetical protein
MSDVAGAIAAAVRRRAGGGRLKIGVFYRRDPERLAGVLNLGHDAVAAGDSFRALWKAARHLGVPKSRAFCLVEARFDALPFRPGGLDALVLLSGLPRGAPYEETIASLKRFLAPGGTLIFAHPVTDGRLGRLARLLRSPFLASLPPLPRHALCRGAMAVGYGDVGQIVPAGRALVPWVVTFATAGRR